MAVPGRPQRQSYKVPPQVETNNRVYTFYPRGRVTGQLCLATLGKGVCGGRIISFLTLIRQGSEQVSRLCRKSTDNIEDAFDNVTNLVAFGMGASVKRCLFLRRANYIECGFLVGSVNLSVGSVSLSWAASDLWRICGNL